MPWQKKSKQRAGRVVRRKLADGSVKEYRYAPYKPQRPKKAPDTIEALIRAYQSSPEWAATSPKTKVNRTIYLRPLDEIGHLPVAGFKRRDILTIRDAIAAERGPSAASGFVQAAAVLFGWAVDRGWIEHSPAHRVKRLPTKPLPAWSEEQFAFALPRVGEPLRRALVLARYTGQRRADLCALTWGAYDGGHIRLKQGKTKVALAIPCHPALKAELDSWRGGSVIPLPGAPILTMADGRRWRPNYLSDALRDTGQKIGLPKGLNVHGLRKLAAASLAEAGCSSREIMAITGHRTLAMVEFYTRSADQKLLAEAAIARLTKPTIKPTM